VAGDNELAAYLTAEISSFTDGLEKAKGAVKSFGEQATADLARFGPALAAVFSADKIKSFVTEGIKDFAQWERSLDTLGAKVTASGTAWNTVKAEVMGYAQQIQETTRFSDDQVVGSLNNLMLRVNNLTTAYQLNEQAMNFSVLTGKSLEESATILGLAYQGNTRGMMQLARALGVTGDEAKNTQALFDILATRADNLARSEANLATEIDKAKNAQADAAKSIGEALAPAYVVLLRAGTLLATGFKRMTDDIGIWAFGIVETVNILLQGIVNSVRITVTYVTTAWKHPIDATKKFLSDWTANIRDTLAAEGRLASTMYDEMTKGEKRATSAATA
jgi:hypothetical protein